MIRLLLFGSSLLSVAWPQHTMQELLEPGQVEIEDPYHHKKSTTESLHQFLKKLPEEMRCSSALMAQEQEYLRYLFRLQVLSYLQVALSSSPCNRHWPKMLDQCRPQYGPLVNLVTRLKQSPLKTRSKKLDLSFMTPQACGEMETLWHSICNETDTLYGLSELASVKKLLLHSHSMALFPPGKAEDCLWRYQTLFKTKEHIPSVLGPWMDGIYQSLSRSNADRYIQGELFIRGSLREFERQGLDEVLLGLVVKTPAVVTQLTKASPPPPWPTTKDKSIADHSLPLKTQEVSPTPVQAPPRVSSEPPPKWTAVDKALAILTREKLSKVPVNLLEVEEDFAWEEEDLINIRLSLKPFQSRETLSLMKTREQFGSYCSPVEYLFLQILLAEFNHQALFNIMYVIGEQFFLRHSFGDQHLTMKIELINNESTGHKWAFSVIAFEEKEKTACISLEAGDQVLRPK